MLLGKTVAVVVPAYNEGAQIVTVLETMPDFVDHIVVVNDCSRDDTRQRVLDYMAVHNTAPACDAPPCDDIPVDTGYNRAEILVQQMDEEEIKFFVPSRVHNASPHTDRVILVDNLVNGGVGAAIARGYKLCKDLRIDCTAVMAGDGQMDPAELEGICLPVVAEGIDYVKGNRLIHRSAWLVIPKLRYFGNSILSMLTKIASGYWRVSDTQTGYTAISLKALQGLRIHKIYKRYGMPNDMLVKLNIAFCTVREVEIKPVYNVGETSKMNIFKVIPTISWLLFKSFFKRLWIKYLFKDFHPLFMLYHLAFFTLFGSAVLFFRLMCDFFQDKSWTFSALLLFVFLTISGIQFLLSAMWMDMLDNDRLYK
ncbi:glycosyltransferase family 2 protein [Solidesulfovibrio sp.]|uniref:glycosyltransferase family 2 protein n=1 Tax=Solidesulfovibrio sp. TaxID=2910990 RepID=UPI002626EDA8|nr:glycosyltransferase family 2 protein [Solidesulfovibrio sp.]